MAQQNQNGESKMKKEAGNGQPVSKTWGKNAVKSTRAVYKKVHKRKRQREHTQQDCETKSTPCHLGKFGKKDTRTKEPLMIATGKY